MAHRSWHRMIVRVEKNGIGTLCKEKNPSNLWGRGEYPKHEQCYDTKKDLPWVTAGVLTTGIDSISEAVRETNQKYRNLRTIKEGCQPGYVRKMKRHLIKVMSGSVRVTASFINGYVWWSRLKRHYFCCGQPYEMLYERGVGMDISLAVEKMRGFDLPVSI